MSARGVLRVIEGGRHGFWCPGCKEMHVVTSGWSFNGDYDKPTFNPSILVRGSDFTDAGRAAYEKWYAEGCPKPAPERFESRPTVCHSFVREGQIQFLGDCTHELANRTIPLGAMPSDIGGDTQ